ncbi:MAG: TrkH family potassium uptake protein [Azonexus sp.]|nr:TrkH family potassium uptake protein [Azonexus sp.]
MILMLFGLTMLLPIGLSHWNGDGAETSFDEAILLTLLCGAFLRVRYHPCRRDLKVRDGFLLVVLTWTVLPLFAAVPLMLQLDMSFTDAYFEAVAGVSTTGATVLSGLDTLPPSINLWRCQLNWLGGMGLVVLAVAILPLLGIGGRQMMQAEIPGPMKDAKMTPRVADAAKGLWFIYFGLTFACTVAYYWAGMSWFDAVCNAFSTLALGGFSTHDASFGYFNSVAVEWVAISFMILAGINFATHFVAISGRSLRPYTRDPEAGWFIGVLAFSALMLAVYIWKDGIYPDLTTALRHTIFHVVSVATTTGFATQDYGQWPIFTGLWMLFLANFATSAGSTGGGLKMLRALLLYKQVYRELIRVMHPATVYNVRLGGQVAPQSVLFAVLAFAFVYVAITVALTLLMSFTGLDIVTAFSAVTASLSNTGPGLGLVGPAANYAVLTDFQTWVCSIAMLLGRLEIFTLLVVLTPAFWRK